VKRSSVSGAGLLSALRIAQLRHAPQVCLRNYAEVEHLHHLGDNTARSRTTANASDNWSDWEFMWAPYDISTYKAVLDETRSDDMVVEIGAGDLRLAKLLAEKARAVYAFEIRPELIREGARKNGHLPPNVFVICADARLIQFPKDVTLAVLLMRHCQHFQLYAQKLRAIGCRRLITNARWKMGVEVVDLMAPRMNFQELVIGWYACLCGSVGFQSSAPERLTRDLLSANHEVFSCPACTRSLQLTAEVPRCANELPDQVLKRRPTIAALAGDSANCFSTRIPRS
jgi:hypothetical protein